MPGIDGIALARMIRSESAFGAPAMVMLTSLGSGNARAIKEAGITASLNKPVKEAALLETILQALSVRRTESQPGALEESSDAGSGARSHALRVLVAEDNPVNQKVAARMLEKLGHRADIVGNGKEAVSALSTVPYDIVLMDCNMPEMDGFEATGAIRSAEPPTRRTVIIAMTANALEGDRDRCLAAGMDDYLSKPITQQRLAACLASWMPRSAEEPETTTMLLEDFEPESIDQDRLRELAALGDEDDPLWLKTIVSTFLGDLSTRIIRLKAALEEENAEEFRTVAHALKGSAGNMGAMRLAEIAREMQTLGEARRLEQGHMLVSRIEKEAERVRSELSALMTQKTGVM